MFLINLSDIIASANGSFVSVFADDTRVSMKISFLAILYGEKEMKSLNIMGCGVMTVPFGLTGMTC